jgi:hypothetical protein
MSHILDWAPVASLRAEWPGRALAPLRALRHHLILLLGLLALLALPLSVRVTMGRAAWGLPATPADRFMQSVVARDGELGWRQLCPALQGQLPLEQVRDQALAQRLAEAGRAPKLTVDPVGARARPTGGKLHIYVVTARHPDGHIEQKTYTVQTAESGCVEKVE